MGPNTVKLNLPNHMKIHPTVNISQVKPYFAPQDGQEVQRPAPVRIDDSVEYKVEKVLDAKGRGRQKKFLVKWKGYPDEDKFLGTPIPYDSCR